jgi:hypothetical protein
MVEAQISMLVETLAQFKVTAKKCVVTNITKIQPS